MRKEESLAFLDVAALCTVTEKLKVKKKKECVHLGAL